MESVFLLSLVYPEKPENSIAKATELEYVKKNTKKKDGGIQMEKVTLFSHILPEEQERMWVCFQMREVVYENNEIIMEYTNTMKKIGLIAEGQASLYGSDAEGNQYLMDELKKDDVFGEPLLLPEMSQHYYVCAKAKTRVIFIGHEVKSLRLNNVNMKDSFAIVKNGEVFLVGMHISPYKMATMFKIDPMRNRRLLLHKSEIRKLKQKVEQKGYTLVPTKLYFKDALVKVEYQANRQLPAYCTAHVCCPAADNFP